MIAECLTDIDELNRYLATDPELAANMAEMGIIKRVPFHRDHNEVIVTKWDWTDYGRSEMIKRLETAAVYAMNRGAGKQ